ncbi:MAG: hypothetical protein HC819_13510 [Cyclobacteriaceae bacterium]|nr:hypothetical protein [Cyclobacteriaceae bacterium]
MKIRSIYMCTAALSLMFACKSPSEKARNSEALPAAEVGIPHHSSDGAHAVELNDGKKWTANPETTQGIDAMIGQVEAYKSGDDISLLKEKLENEFKMIFQQCTMTGEAHEQLHNYLIPLKGKISRLGVDTYMDNVNEIAEYLHDYRLYFE